MTIEIHQPELEALIRELMASGAFESVEDALLQALKSTRTGKNSSTATPPINTIKSLTGSPRSETSLNPVDRHSLVEVCAMVRGLTEGLDFSRNPSTGRPIDLS